MDNIGYISLSHAAMIERANDVTANNIANANTEGFRAGRNAFEQMVVSTKSGTATDEMAYSLDVGTYSDLTEGALIQTGNPLDLALQGDAWFAFETTAGENTIGRGGSFVLSAEGDVLTASGDRVLDAGGAPLNLPLDAGDITVAADGTISNGAGEVLGQVGMFEAAQADTWPRRPGSAVAVPADQWPLLPSLNGSMLQGFSEQSNVNPILEMTKMITLQRSYERAMNLAESADKLRSTTLDRLGRSA
jgi:flagellar basal-body rod protein FlgF